MAKTETSQPGLGFLVLLHSSLASFILHTEISPSNQLTNQRRAFSFCVSFQMNLLLKEYLVSGDISEAEHCLRDLEVPHFHHELVYEVCGTWWSRLSYCQDGWQVLTSGEGDQFCRYTKLNLIHQQLNVCIISKSSFCLFILVNFFPSADSKVLCYWGRKTSFVLHSELCKEFPLRFGQSHCVQRKNFSWRPAFLFPAKDAVFLADLVAFYAWTDFVPRDSYENSNSKEKFVASNSNQVWNQCLDMDLDKVTLWWKMITIVYYEKMIPLFFYYLLCWHNHFNTHIHQIVNSLFFGSGYPTRKQGQQCHLVVTLEAACCMFNPWLCFSVLGCGDGAGVEGRHC